MECNFYPSTQTDCWTGQGSSSWLHLNFYYKDTTLHFHLLDKSCADQSEVVLSHNEFWHPTTEGTKGSAEKNNLTKSFVRNSILVHKVNNKIGLKSRLRYLRHVQPWLSDGEFEDAAGSVDVAQDRLQLWELDPGGAVLRTELQVFLVQLPAAVELTELQLQLDVALQQFVLRAFPDCWALRGGTLMSCF